MKNGNTSEVKKTKSRSQWHLYKVKFVQNSNPVTVESFYTITLENPHVVALSRTLYPHTFGDDQLSQSHLREIQ